MEAILQFSSGPQEIPERDSMKPRHAGGSCISVASFYNACGAVVLNNNKESSKDRRGDPSDIPPPPLALKEEEAEEERDDSPPRVMSIQEAPAEEVALTLAAASVSVAEERSQEESTSSKEGGPIIWPRMSAEFAEVQREMDGDSNSYVLDDLSNKSIAADEEAPEGDQKDGSAVSSADTHQVQKSSAGRRVSVLNPEVLAAAEEHWGVWGGSDSDESEEALTERGSSFSSSRHSSFNFAPSGSSSVLKIGNTTGSTNRGSGSSAITEILKKPDSAADEGGGGSKRSFSLFGFGIWRNKEKEKDSS